MWRLYLEQFGQGKLETSCTLTNTVIFIDQLSVLISKALDPWIFHFFTKISQIPSNSYNPQFIYWFHALNLINFDDELLYNQLSLSFNSNFTQFSNYLRNCGNIMDFHDQNKQISLSFSLFLTLSFKSHSKQILKNKKPLKIKSIFPLSCFPSQKFEGTTFIKCFITLHRQMEIYIKISINLPT